MSDFKVKCENKNKNDIIHKISKIIKMKVLAIKTKSKNYNIYIGHDIISKINKIIKKENINIKKTLIIVDKNVPKKFIKKIKSKIKSEIKYILL